MKTVFVLLTALCVSTALRAQEVPQQCDCYQSFTASDNICSNSSNCSSFIDCQSTPFTASCTGHYDISVFIGNCLQGAHCTDFLVCAELDSANGNFIGHCFINDCGTCSNSCGQTFCLYTGGQYKLRVCLRPCTSSSCPLLGTCTASATVTYCGPSQTTCQ